MFRSTLIITAALGLLLFGAPDKGLRADELTAANRSIAEHHIIPGYQRLADATGALDESARQFCARPGQAGLVALRDAYHVAMDAWQGIRHIRFGPVELFLRHHRFQLWPDKRNAVARHLGGLIAKADGKVTDAARFAQASVAVQGLSALEQLLFGNAAEHLLGGSEQAYRCALTMAISGNLATMSRDILTEWTQARPSYLHQLSHPGPGNPWFQSDQDVSARLLSALYENLTEAEEQKLARPLGASAQEARPHRAESWRSARSLRNLRINLGAALELYGIQGEGGFSDYLAVSETGQRLDRQIHARFKHMSRMLEALPGDGLKAVLSGEERGRAEHARKGLAVLRALVANEVSAELGLALGFNSLDGD